jgi:energy-coupling factor transport system permease protein
MTQALTDEGPGLPAGARPPGLERETFSDRLAVRFDEWSAHRERREAHFLRYVPIESPIHSLWAGTKFVAVSVLSIALFVWPTWHALALVAALLLVVLLLVRIPMSAVPRLPLWIWPLLLLGAVIAFASGGAPVAHLRGLRVGLGGIEAWLRFAVLAIELLCSTAIIGWTTPLAELAPAVSRLASPLKRLKVPVDELAIALALSIRCLPLVVEEMRTLRDARRARRAKTPRRAADIGEDAIELAVATLLSALRRASELADAIEARGGATVVRRDGRGPGRSDWLALALVAVVVVGMGLLS